MLAPILPHSNALPVARSNEEMRKLQMEDPSIGFVLQAKEKDQLPNPDLLKGQSLTVRRLAQLWPRLMLDDGILWRRYEDLETKQEWKQLVLPQCLREEVMEEIHAGVMGGYVGESKTLQQLKRRFYWPGHSRDVKTWCQTCSSCASRKTQAPKNCAPLQTIKAGSPMQIIAVDIMGPLPESSNKNSCILVVADYFTRWMNAVAIHDQEATTVAQKLVDDVFCQFGMPEQLHSDQGKQFESKLIQELCKILKISKTRTTAYHPQCDSLVERFNRTLQDMIATITFDHPFDWEEALPKVCFAYNTSIHSTTGYSPFYLMYGREPHLPIDIVYGTQSHSPISVNSFVQKSQKLLQQAFDQVRKHLSAGHQRQKDIYDKRIHGEPYKEGDTVWLLDTVVEKGQSKKFHHPWKGPYRVLKKISDCDYLIESVADKHTQTIVHFNRLKRCKEGTRFQQDLQTCDKSQPSTDPPGSNQHEAVSHSVGENLELVDSNDTTTLTRPVRTSRPPSRYTDFISH